MLHSLYAAVTQVQALPTLQRARASALSNFHLLLGTCFRGLPYLSRDRTRQWMVEAIAAACAKHAFHLWAWVIMPEHVHLLAWPTQPTYDISLFLKSLKEPVTKKARLFAGRYAPEWMARMSDVQPNGKRSFRFWQRGGGYDKNIDDPRDIWDRIDYMHNNPVKRALCARAEDWPWSSAGDYLLPRQGKLVIDKETVPRDLRQLRKS